MRRPSRMHVAQAQPLPCPQQVTDGELLQVDGKRALLSARMLGRAQVLFCLWITWSEDVPVLRSCCSASAFCMPCHTTTRCMGLTTRAILFQPGALLYVGRTMISSRLNTNVIIGALRRTTMTRFMLMSVSQLTMPCACHALKSASEAHCIV